jgi:hypothetical protein
MHGLDQIFLTPQNIQHLEKVLLLVIEGCTEVNDPNVNRCCFTIFHELINHWLFFSNALIEEKTKNFFTQFVVTKCTPASFLVVKKKHFDLKDVQCLSVVKEIATLQLVLTQAIGEEYIRFVQDVCLPSLLGSGNSFDLTSQYANELRTRDRQRIINAYKSVVSTFD